MHLCKQGDSGNESRELWTGRKMRGRYEYYIMTRDSPSGAHSFNSHRTSDQSGEAGARTEVALIHGLALSSPVKKVQSGALNIEWQCGLRRYSVKYSSPESVSWSFSVSLSAISTVSWQQRNELYFYKQAFLHFHSGYITWLTVWCNILGVRLQIEQKCFRFSSKSDIFKDSNTLLGVISND